jgi:hypothetical protein
LMDLHEHAEDAEGRWQRQWAGGWDAGLALSDLASLSALERAVQCDHSGTQYTAFAPD